jgi:coenzyme Q-binding protein COQ10
MPRASVKRNINKKKNKLIEFVLDIEKYPEFIPFCLDSKVYDRKEENNQILIIADLTKKMIRLMLLI